MHLKIFCDGGARGNPGPAAWAFLVYDEENHLLAKKNEKMAVATNNSAEYTAVFKALGWLAENRFKISQGGEAEQVTLLLDSQLVVSQLNGLFKVKNPQIRELVVQIREAEQAAGGNISYALIPREENSLADRLVNQTLDNP